MKWNRRNFTIQQEWGKIFKNYKKCCFIFGVCPSPVHTPVFSLDKVNIGALSFGGTNCLFFHKLLNFFFSI